MKVLLTGASGNFGKEYMRQTTHDVTTLNRGDWQQLDDKIADIDVVLHAASDLHTPVADSPSISLDSNVLSTAVLLEACRKHDIKRFVFMSSCAVYGESMRTNESSVCQPTSINGIGKFLNEKVISDFCINNNIEYEILRVFNMYGGEDNFSILSHIRRALETGVAFNLNNGGIAQRDFIHVSDVVAIVNLLMNKEVPFTHVNVGTGISTRILTLVEHVLEKYPALQLQHAEVEEAEYSRADIRRLRTLTDRTFIRIEDYLKNDFVVDG